MPRRERALSAGNRPLRSLRRRFARAVLALLRWRSLNEPPDLPRYVLVAAPHTSNWDFLYFVLFVWSLEVRLSFLAKHTLFWWPQGLVLRWLGGIPVNRAAPHDLVTRLTARFEGSEQFVLLIPAEGTRGNARHWKSGFYRIARDASVPVVAAALDWRTRTLRFTEPLEATEDPAGLMKPLREFYRGTEGRHPERTTPVRLQQESVESSRAISRPPG